MNLIVAGVGIMLLVAYPLIPKLLASPASLSLWAGLVPSILCLGLAGTATYTLIRTKIEAHATTLSVTQPWLSADKIERGRRAGLSLPRRQNFEAADITQAYFELVPNRRSHITMLILRPKTGPRQYISLGTFSRSDNHQLATWLQGHHIEVTGVENLDR